ncbi:hypothetical protein RJT34_05412 [Clitoria ternatea]|uniref:Uncharacterized protein n=1 Tax=Clitoria ternatea TaxID=43366 RepID=A0AAN9K1E2_CLITE
MGFCVSVFVCRREGEGDLKWLSSSPFLLFPSLRAPSTSLSSPPVPGPPPSTWAVATRGASSLTNPSVLSSFITSIAPLSSSLRSIPLTHAGKTSNPMLTASNLPSISVPRVGSKLIGSPKVVVQEYKTILEVVISLRM